MSKPNDNPTPINVIPTDVKDEVVEKRPNILVRGYRKMRSNPKNTLAVVGGAALLGGAAFLGRKSAPSCDTILITVDDDLELEPVAEPDTTVA